MQVLRLAGASLCLDWRILTMRTPSPAWRLGFLGRKYLSLLNLALGCPTTLRATPVSFSPADLNELGSLQSMITHFYDYVVRSDILPRPAPLVVDVGAHIGTFCSAVKLFYPTARVMAFEPSPGAFAALLRNTAGLPGVEIFNYGLGDKNESLPFHVHKYTQRSSFIYDPADPRYELGPVTVQVKCLDDVIGPDLRPDLVKIDVEGFEGQVVLGGRSVLSRTGWLLLELSLGRAHSARSNLDVLRDVLAIAPSAQIVRFGRPVGSVPSRPECQDALIRLASDQGADGA